MTILQTQLPKFYDDCGIEGVWGKTRISLNSVRMGMSDDMASLQWDLCFAVVRNEQMRALPITDGWPRRFTLLLDDTWRDSIRDQFQQDAQLAKDVCGANTDVALLMRGWVVMRTP